MVNAVFSERFGRAVARCREISCSMGGLWRALNPVMVDNLVFLFDCRAYPRSVSEDWCLFVDVYCGSCLFLIFSSSFFFLPREGCVSWLYKCSLSCVTSFIFLFSYYCIPIKHITKTRLFKYTENFPTKKKKKAILGKKFGYFFIFLLKT